MPRITKLAARVKEMLSIKIDCCTQTRSLANSSPCLCSFAGAQIRNTASVGGNIVTGSPISDVNPLYMAMGATFTVEGKGTEPRQIAANDFFLGYRCATPSFTDSTCC